MNLIKKAVVELISVNKFDAIKWLKKEMGYNLIEANIIVNFEDEKKAIAFYFYLQNCLSNSVRLIIDVSYDTTGICCAFGIVINEPPYIP